MVSDLQVRRVVALMQTEKSKALAADKAAMDEKTARKYVKLGKMRSEVLPVRYWRTREDPFTEVWEGVKAMLDGCAGFELGALHQAVEVACPAGSRTESVHMMSDDGSQLTSKRYEAILETLGIKHVATSYNNPKGNADTERFMRTLKEEVVWPNEFASLEEASAAVEDFFRFSDQDYLHSALAGMSPIDFEDSLNQTKTAAA